MKQKYKQKRTSNASARRSRRSKASPAANAMAIKELEKKSKEGTEIKIQKLEGLYLGTPKPQNPALTGPLYYHASCLGLPASTWIGPQGGATNFYPLQGFTWPQGVQSNQRIGRYLFLKHTTMNVRLNMISPVKGDFATQFRIIVFKAKRNAAFGTSGGNPNEDLFLDSAGNPMGVNTSSDVDTRTFEFMNMIVNKRNYDVHMDKKVILQPQHITVQGSNAIVSPLSTNYPQEYTFPLTLKHNSKAAFPPGNYGEPLDLNYQYCIFVIASPYGNTNTGADNWRISLRGTVSCIDG